MACGAPWSACAQNMRMARIETTCGVCASQAQVVRSRVRGYSPRRSCGPFPLGFVEGGDRQPLWPAADSRLREGPVQHHKPLLSTLQKKLKVRPHRALLPSLRHSRTGPPYGVAGGGTRPSGTTSINGVSAFRQTVQAGRRYQGLAAQAALPA